MAAWVSAVINGVVAVVNIIFSNKSANDAKKAEAARLNKENQDAVLGASWKAQNDAVIKSSATGYQAWRDFLGMPDSTGEKTVAEAATKWLTDKGHDFPMARPGATISLPSIFLIEQYGGQVPPSAKGSFDPSTVSAAGHAVQAQSGLNSNPITSPDGGFLSGKGSSSNPFSIGETTIMPDSVKAGMSPLLIVGLLAAGGGLIYSQTKGKRSKRRR